MIDLFTLDRMWSCHSTQRKIPYFLNFLMKNGEKKNNIVYM